MNGSANAKESANANANVPNAKERGNANGSVTANARGRGKGTVRENENVIVNVRGIARENGSIVTAKNTKEKKKKLLPIPVLRLDLPYLNDLSVNYSFHQFYLFFFYSVLTCC